MHLKGEVTYHPPESSSRGAFLTVSEDIVSHFSKSGERLVVTPAEERFGGNNISRNGAVFVHKGRLKTKELLQKEGLATQVLDMSEFEKIDGAMTCLSKLFQA